MIQIILASSSPIRRQILENAGLNFTWQAPAVEENIYKEELKAQHCPPDQMALKLAFYKAQQVSRDNTQACVIGCDQVLECNGKIYDKAANMDQAKQHLKEFSGQIHTLHGGMCVLKNGKTLFKVLTQPTLKMVSLTDDFIDTYLREAGRDVLKSVGCYQLERQGVQLFESVDGDYFSILGLAVIPLLGFLRAQGDHIK